MRCLTLADAWAQLGGRSVFLSRTVPDSLRDETRRRGHEHCTIGVDLSGDYVVGQAPHARWLGTDETTDARDTLNALAGRDCQWVIVDHYALTEIWERIVRPAARHVLVIDDLADRPHDCDLVVDQNYFAAGAARYAARVPAKAGLLIGPAFALLRPEYAEARRHLTRGKPTIDRVLVFFGGSDPHGLTAMALDALADPSFRHLHVDVVIGQDPVVRAAVESRAARRPGTTIHGPRLHLADLMAAADLSLGAGGATTWERMCLGLRSLVVAVADNQLPVCGELNRDGLIQLVGAVPRVSAEDLGAAIRRAIAGAHTNEAMLRGMQLSDGCGVARVIDAMRDRSEGV